MAGKLTKLKSVLKKLNSFNNKHQSRSTVSAMNYCPDQFSSPESGGADLQAVYVGKTRRRYLVSSDIVHHPLFRELAERSGSDETINVSCEVVLFDHLLWMLENADEQQPDSLDDLVEFYAC